MKLSSFIVVITQMVNFYLAFITQGKYNVGISNFAQHYTSSEMSENLMSLHLTIFECDLICLNVSFLGDTRYFEHRNWVNLQYGNYGMIVFYKDKVSSDPMSMLGGNLEVNILPYCTLMHIPLVQLTTINHSV